jgi:hypothetical protein
LIASVVEFVAKLPGLRVQLTLGAGSADEIRDIAMMRAARLITEARSGLKTVLTDRDLTVTQGNASKHRKTVDLLI